MTIVFAHNFYRIPGGEDEVFAAETKLLESHGHTVVRCTENSNGLSLPARLKLPATVVWSAKSYSKLRRLVRQNKAEVVHFHNIFPLLSPSCYYAARREGAAVVQTLHNYRLVCPSATLFRSGRPCEDCVGRPIPWPAIVHGCYRHSRLASLATASMLSIHRAAGTWSNAVDAYITLTEFARERFVAGGLPSGKLMVKPNFVDPDPGVGNGAGGFALFVGRLSEEKGVDTLLNAWRSLPDRMPLKVVGDGPLGGRLRSQYSDIAHVQWLGQMGKQQVLDLMKNATCLVFPSLCYEGLPMTIVEALSAGLPVLASRLGAIPEVVEKPGAGLCFTPGDAMDLVKAVQQVLNSSSTLAGMRAGCRDEYRRKYTADDNYQSLMNVYQRAIQIRRSQDSGSSSIRE